MKNQITMKNRYHFKVFQQILKNEGIELIEEYRFSERRFRFDFANLKTKIAIEVEGGVYTNGAHGSVSGILRDIEKYNLATSMGWVVLRILPKDLTKSKTINLIIKTYTTRLLQLNIANIVEI